jgi:hypothetical protein
MDGNGPLRPRAQKPPPARFTPVPTTVAFVVARVEGTSWCRMTVQTPCGEMDAWLDTRALDALHNGVGELLPQMRSGLTVVKSV